MAELLASQSPYPHQQRHASALSGSATKSNAVSTRAGTQRFVIADIAAYRLAIGQRLRGYLGGQQGLHDVAAPYAVGRRDRHVGGAHAVRPRLRPRSARRRRTRLRAAWLSSTAVCPAATSSAAWNAIDCIAGSASSLDGSRSAPAAQAWHAESSISCGPFVRIHELVQARGVGIAVVDLHAGGAVAGDRKRFGSPPGPASSCEALLIR